MQISTYDELDKNFFSKIEFESISSVNDIINAVRKDGDNAVRKYAKKFGGSRVNSYLVICSK